MASLAKLARIALVELGGKRTQARQHCALVQLGDVVDVALGQLRDRKAARLLAAVLGTDRLVGASRQQAGQRYDGSGGAQGCGAHCRSIARFARHGKRGYTCGLANLLMDTPAWTPNALIPSKT